LVVRHLVATSAVVMLFVTGCSDDGSESGDGSDAASEETVADDTVPRLTTDLDRLAAQLEEGEIEVPPGYEPPPPRQVDAACLSSVLNHLARVGAIAEGDLMLWYSGVQSEETAPVNRAIYALLNAGDCLRT
jgi:hypothetical protein